MRQAAALALARLGASEDAQAVETIEALLALLGEPNQDLAESAVLGLGVLGRAEAVPYLLALVRDDGTGRALCNEQEVPERMRAFAAYGIALVGPLLSEGERGPLVGQMMDLCQSKDRLDTDVEVAVLAAIGLLPLPEHVSLAALRAAGEGGRPDRRVLSRRSQIAWLVDGFLSRAFAHKATAVRAQIPISIARLTEGAPAPLREALAQILLDALRGTPSEPNDVRASLALALGELGDCDASGTDAKIRDALVKEIDGGEPMARRFALVALGRIAGRPAAGGDSTRGSEVALEALLEVLSSGRSQLGPWAALGLGLCAEARLSQGQSVDPASALALRQTLSDCRRPQELGAYALALGMARDVNASGLLADRLESIEDTSARGPVALALGMLGDSGATATLRGLLERAHAQPAFFVDLAVALGLAGDLEVVDTLLRLLQDANSQGTRVAAHLALARVGDARALDPLIADLGAEDQASTARASAAYALGRICDVRDLPWETSLSLGSNYALLSPTLTDGQGGVLDYE